MNNMTPIEAEGLMPLKRSTGKRPKLLLVDDVETNLRIVCRRLEDDNFDIHAVDSGEKALRFIEQDTPDLVLLDYMMPKMSGIDVLNIVRGEWNITDMPIIMLTARAEGNAVVEALEAGADDYVSKPIDFEVLKARIETQLGKLKSKDSLRAANQALDERVAMRVLAFDQLRDELEREIALRKEAERELASCKFAQGLLTDAEPVDGYAPEGQDGAPFDIAPLADETGPDHSVPTGYQDDHPQHSEEPMADAYGQGHKHAPEAPPPMSEQDLQAKQDAIQIINHLIETAATGKPINQAILYSLLGKLESIGGPG